MNATLTLNVEELSAAIANDLTQRSKNLDDKRRDAIAIAAYKLGEAAGLLKRAEFVTARVPLLGVVEHFEADLTP
ncbi:MAG TPA: hypothetical protein VED01_07735 [Burkholderiales bacterium]|nr:hypothetical protein [Burkholderiales bacterium]